MVLGLICQVRLDDPEAKDAAVQLDDGSTDASVDCRNCTTPQFALSQHWSRDSSSTRRKWTYSAIPARGVETLTLRRGGSPGLLINAR